MYYLLILIWTALQGLLATTMEGPGLYGDMSETWGHRNHGPLLPLGAVCDCQGPLRLD